MRPKLTRRRTGSWVLAPCVLSVALGCRAPEPAIRDPILPFDALFSVARTTPLLGGSLGAAADILVTPHAFIIVDMEKGDLKVFRRSNGALARVIGRPGDGVGEFRTPAAITSIDESRFAVLDGGRSVVSVWDTVGRLVSETHIAGTWVGLTSVADSGRIVVSGVVPRRDGSDRSKRELVHEFDLEGNETASYRDFVPASNEWEATFGGVFVASLGRVVISGAYSSNAVSIHDRLTGRERTVRVAQGWYRPLVWPTRGDPAYRGSGVQRVTAWARKQILMSALVPVGPQSFLARFDAVAPSGEKLYFYALADTAGRTAVVTHATRVRLHRMVGDTIYGLRKTSDGATEVWAGTLSRRFGQ